LRCLSSVPINIKPHSTNEARARPPHGGRPDVYIGIEARRIPGVSCFPDFLASTDYYEIEQKNFIGHQCF